MGIIALCAKVARMSWNIDEDDGPVGDDLRARVVEARNEHDAMKAEIAALKAEVSEARRHAVGVMAAGFNRALDEAGAPPAESPGLRVYAMRDEIARLRAALAAGPAALRKFGDEDICARAALAEVEAAQEAALKEGK